MTSKAELIQRIRSELAARRERLEMAAREAHAAATDPDAKAESKYDTRGLEASYLAAGQAKQAESLAEAIQALESASFPDFEPDAPIAAGALVELIGDDGPAWFLLAPAAGGLEFEFEDAPLTVLTPESRLYSALLGRRPGESLDTPPATITEVR
jgi:hypothetical protein